MDDGEGGHPVKDRRDERPRWPLFRLFWFGAGSPGAAFSRDNEQTLHLSAPASSPLAPARSCSSLFQLAAPARRSIAAAWREASRSSRSVSYSSPTSAPCRFSGLYSASRIGFR